MSKVVNINTASREELVTIKDIGDARAKLIINARSEKGALTLEDLKLIPGLPNTMWDPLVASGRVVFENKEDVDNIEHLKRQIGTLTSKLTNTEQEMKKMHNNCETQLLFANQEKVRLQHEYKNQIKELEETLKGEVEEKNEYSYRIEELKEKYQNEAKAAEECSQQDKEKLLIKLQQERTEKKELSKELDALYQERQRETERQKEQMDILDIEKREMSDVVKTIERKFETEKNVFMEKLKHFSETLDEERALNAQYMEREEQAAKRCARLEEEIKHLQVSKRINDTIYQHEANAKTTTKESPKESYGKSFDNIEKPADRAGRSLNVGPSPQKLPCYDGKTEWKPYYIQFIHFSNQYKWDSRQRLDKLIECLRDKALKFYSTRPISVQNDFALLSEKMNQRFGNKDLPYTIRRQLQEAKQTLDETVEEFAERIQEMATDGYGPNTPENVVETISVDAFLKGCNNKKAILFAMEKNPVTLDDPLQCVKSSIHNQRILLGQRQDSVKRVQFDSDNESEPDMSELTVRALNRYDRRSSPARDNQYTNNHWQSSVETRIKKTEQDICDIKEDVSKILQAVSSNRTMFQRSASPRRSPDRSDSCFRCQEKGHFAQNCPNIAAVARIPRSPSPKPIENGKHLNNQGLKM